ncbi:hypothetical protein LZL87_013751 [Fusarium oxysporum]|nr:hypothetical protein LZL87_013751 [Fusarium oxysporum]
MAQQCSQRRPCQAKFDDELSDNRDPYDPYGDHDAFPPQSRGHPRLHSLNLPPPRCHKSERRRPLPHQSRYPKDPYNDPRQFESYQRRNEPDRRGRSGGPDRRRKSLSAPPIDLHVGSRRRKSKSPRSGRAPSLDSETRTGRKPQPEHHSRRADVYERPRMVEDYNENLRMVGMSSQVPRSMDPYNRGAYSRKSSRSYPDYPDDPHEKSPNFAIFTATRLLTIAVQHRIHRRSRGNEVALYIILIWTMTIMMMAVASEPAPKSETTGGIEEAALLLVAARQPHKDPELTSRVEAPCLPPGFRTAFTAGVQAAIKSHDDPAPWLGAKGAKVATAALDAALVDGCIGQKHRGTARQNIIQKGVDFASAQVAAGGISHCSKSRHRR